MSTPPQSATCTAAVTLVLEMLGSPTIKATIEAKRADLVAGLQANGISAPYSEALAKASLAKLEATSLKGDNLSMWTMQTTGNIAWKKFTESQVADTQSLRDRTGAVYEAICASADEYRSGWDKAKLTAVSIWDTGAPVVMKKTREVQDAATPRLTALDEARQMYDAARVKLTKTITDIRSNNDLAVLLPLLDRLAATELSTPRGLEQLSNKAVLEPFLAQTAGAIDLNALKKCIEDATKRFVNEREATSKSQTLLEDVARGLAELAAARSEYDGKRRTIHDAIADVRSNNELVAVLKPLCDHVAATTLGPANALLQDSSEDAVLAPFLAQTAAGVIGLDGLIRALQAATDEVVREGQDLKPDELQKDLAVLRTILVSIQKGKAKLFIKAYKYAGCCVLAKLNSAQRDLLYALFYGDQSATIGLQLNEALLGKANASEVGDGSPCDAKLLKECFIAASQACKGKKADQLTHQERKDAAVAACNLAKAATHVFLPGVRVFGTPKSIGPDNVQFPSQFEVPDQFRTDARCVKHVEEETMGDQSLQGLQAYFMEMIAACKEAKIRWANLKGHAEKRNPKVIIEKGAKFKARWTIHLKEVGNENEIFHIDSGYEKSEWVTPNK